MAPEEFRAFLFFLPTAAGSASFFCPAAWFSSSPSSSKMTSLWSVSNWNNGVSVSERFLRTLAFNRITGGNEGDEGAIGEAPGLSRNSITGFDFLVSLSARRSSRKICRAFCLVLTTTGESFPPTVLGGRKGVPVNRFLIFS